MQVSTSTAISATPTSSLATVSGSTVSTSSVTNVSTSPKVHLVKAGSGGFHFEPARLNNVSVGDVVTFEFYPPDHSVARAEYGSACMPYEYTGKDKTGFWSGTQWVDTVGDITQWNLTINSTEPIFYYCAAPDSCTGKWMIGAINPNGTQTLDSQIRAARAADFQVAPGEAVPKESSPSPSPEAASSRLSGGAIAGIILGGIVFLVICAGVLVYVTRRKFAKTVDKPSETICTGDHGITEPRAYTPIISPDSPYWPLPLQPSIPSERRSVPSELPAHADHDSKSWNL